MAELNRYVTMSLPMTAVVVDIEGTTSAISYVHATLFPYVRRRLDEFVITHCDDPVVARQVDAVRVEIGDADAELASVLRQLHRWMDADAKVTSLKSLQGIIWAEGFANGELVSHFYPDAVGALRRWHAQGRQLHVYSSGSVQAQQSLFGHSASGDLRPLISGWFDTSNAGPKTQPSSYRRISAAIETAPDATLFLSDAIGELDAATEAGWHCVGIRRIADGYEDLAIERGRTDHDVTDTFDHIALSDPLS
jgi:enolase-phosphatase E1